MRCYVNKKVLSHIQIGKVVHEIPKLDQYRLLAVANRFSQNSSVKWYYCIVWERTLQLCHVGVYAGISKSSQKIFIERFLLVSSPIFSFEVIQFVHIYLGNCWFGYFFELCIPLLLPRGREGSSQPAARWREARCLQTWLVNSLPLPSPQQCPGWI